MKYIGSVFDRSKPKKPGLSAIAIPSEPPVRSRHLNATEKTSCAECERQHQERNAGGSNAEKADDQRREPREQHSGHNAEPRIEAEQRAEDCDRVGAAAEKRGMTERHQPGEAKQKIKAHGKDGEDDKSP